MFCNTPKILGFKETSCFPQKTSQIAVVAIGIHNFIAIVGAEKLKNISVCFVIGGYWAKLPSSLRHKIYIVTLRLLI